MGARGAIDIFFSERLQETNRGFPGRSYLSFPLKFSSIFFCIFFGQKTPLSKGEKNIFPLPNGIKIKKVLWCKDFFNFSFGLCSFFNLDFTLFRGLHFVDFSICTLHFFRVFTNVGVIHEYLDFGFQRLWRDT